MGKYRNSDCRRWKEYIKIKHDADETAKKAQTESELVKIEEEKIEKIDSMEEAEEELK